MRVVTATLAAIAAALIGAGASGLPAQANDTRPSFAEWLAAVRAEAVDRGIRPEIVEEALGTVEAPLPIVIERDRAQAETVLAIETYISRHVTPAVVRTGREMLATNRPLLDEIAATYAVPAPVIVAIWGIESNFGRFSGVRPTVAALATLAWDPRRATLFRAELFDALEILNRGDIEPSKMRGSWAGAMGQTQFMPSSYLRYAEDFDGDGRRDIWTSSADVFASIANYLRGHGWTPGAGWGREVKVPNEAAQQIAGHVARRDGGCQATRDMTVAQTSREWKALGVTALNGAALSESGRAAALVSGARRQFLVSGNYDALLAYNCAHAYALTVGLLADRIAATGAAAAPAAPPHVTQEGRGDPKE